MIKAVVVDDERPAREELCFLLKSHFDDVEILGEGKSGIEALELCKKHRPDVLFLDIQMPELTGIDVVGAMVATMDFVPKIVFVTAYDHFAIKAFELNATDYILKPVEIERLSKAVDKVKRELGAAGSDADKLKQVVGDIRREQGPAEKITLYHGGRFIPIGCSDIVYATVEDKITFLFTAEGKYEFNGSLTNLEEMLQGSRFFRAHRGHLINLDMVEAVEPWFNNSYQVKLNGIGSLIPISRAQTKEFKKLMNIL